MPVSPSQQVSNILTAQGRRNYNNSGRLFDIPRYPPVITKLGYLTTFSYLTCWNWLFLRKYNESSQFRIFDLLYFSIRLPNNKNGQVQVGLTTLRDTNTERKNSVYKILGPMKSMYYISIFICCYSCCRYIINNCENYYQAIAVHEIQPSEGRSEDFGYKSDTPFGLAKFISKWEIL